MGVCDKCHQPFKMKWVKINVGHSKLIVVCGCRKEVKKQSFAFKKYREAVALGYDTKTGKPLAIDVHGHKFSASDTRYDTKNDPRGWKAIGKKVRPYDRLGRLNR